MYSVDLTVFALCWGLFLVVWGLGWIYNLWKAPRVERRSSLRPVWVVVLALIVLIGWYAPFQPLRSVGSTPLWIAIPGVICLALSTGLTLWARFALGTMWSHAPEVKVGHQLRVDGPYRITRHPIYTGIIGMILGSMLMNGLGAWVLLSLIGVSMLVAKVPPEERLLSETFGEQYRQYQQRVPRLVPGLQLLRRSHS